MHLAYSIVESGAEGKRRHAVKRNVVCRVRVAYMSIVIYGMLISSWRASHMSIVITDTEPLCVIKGLRWRPGKARQPAYPGRWSQAGWRSK
jgi:hypothetical protein